MLIAPLNSYSEQYHEFSSVNSVDCWIIIVDNIIVLFDAYVKVGASGPTSATAVR